MTYAGWTNHQTWQVFTMLDSILEINELVEKIQANYPKLEWTALLAESIANLVKEQNPLSDSTSLYAGLLSASLSEVDWHAIAQKCLPDD
jgi:hypothetical protein